MDGRRRGLPRRGSQPTYGPAVHGGRDTGSARTVGYTPVVDPVVPLRATRRLPIGRWRRRHLLVPRTLRGLDGRKTSELPCGGRGGGPGGWILGGGRGWRHLRLRRPVLRFGRGVAVVDSYGRQGRHRAHLPVSTRRVRRLSHH